MEAPVLTFDEFVVLKTRKEKVKRQKPICHSDLILSEPTEGGVSLKKLVLDYSCITDEGTETIKKTKLKVYLNSGRKYISTKVRESRLSLQRSNSNRQSY